MRPLSTSGAKVWLANGWQPRASKWFFLRSASVVVGVTVIACLAVSLVKHRRKPTAEDLLAAVERNDAARVAEILRVLPSAANARNPSGDTPIFVAVRERNARIARLLLQAGADVNSRCKDAFAPLHLAATQGYLELVRLLLANGADVSAKADGGTTPLHAAVVGGQAEVTACLLAHGADVSTVAEGFITPLHFAARLDYPDVIRILVLHGADVNATPKAEHFVRPPLDFAVDRNNRAAAELLRNLGGVSFREFLLAVESGDEERAQATAIKAPSLICGCDGNGVTPLHRAVVRGHARIWRLLLASGADANAKDKEGRTPLHCAALMGDLDAIAALAGRGAVLNAVDNAGCSARYYASASRESEAADLLASLGADILGSRETRPSSVGEQAFERYKQLLLGNHLAFYDPGRRHPYVANQQSFHDTEEDAIRALAVQFERTPEWVRRNMGASNDLVTIHWNLVRARARED